MKAKDEPNLFELPKIKEIAANHKVSPAQILVAWHVNCGNTVIPKSTNKEWQKQNLEAAAIILKDEEMSQIASLDRHYRYVNGTFFENPLKGYVNIFDD